MARALVTQLKPERKTLASDLIAGLTFAVVNVPQAMGHALLASVNPVLGIYTLMIAVPMGAVFTSSVFMNVSTTSALSVATGAGLAEVPAADKVAALAVLTLLVGAIQLAAGLLKLGSLVRFVSDAVMTGFLNGIAVLIILGQLGDLTGFQSALGNSVARGIDLLFSLNLVNVPTTIIGVLTLGGIVALLRTRLRKFAFIIAIAIATLLLALLTRPGMPTAGLFGQVQTVGDLASIPRALPSLVLPRLDLILTLLLPAFAVAMIGLIQGAGVSQGTPNPDGSYPDVSRDFAGQGAANLATSLIGGVPAGGSISGTVLMRSAGAQSRWANLSAGLFVALVVLLAAPLVERVPTPALAALLIVAGFQGLRVPQATMTWNTGLVPASAMILTFAATLILPLQFAVLVGIVFSILLYVFRQSNKVRVMQWVLQPEGFPLEAPAPAVLPSHQVTVLHVYGSLFFAGARSLEAILPAVGDARGAAVVLSLRGHGDIGSTLMGVLQRYAAALHAADSTLLLAGLDESTRDQLARTGVLAKLGPANIFLATPQLGAALNQALVAANHWVDGHLPPQRPSGQPVSRTEPSPSPS